MKKLYKWLYDKFLIKHIIFFISVFWSNPKKWSRQFWITYGDEIVDILYYGLATLTYSYIIFLNYNFFWQKDIVLAYIGVGLSLVYLSALSRYIRVRAQRRELDKREGIHYKKRRGYFYTILWAISATAVTISAIITGIKWSIEDSDLITGLIIITTAFVVIDKFLGRKLDKALEKHFHMKFNDSNGNDA